ncbi:MAG TPA: serine/threonine-protein kinase [Polyangiales bacterium]|nr:serine/threonine-protein kinase [Polyangiales bacterium]
MRKPELGQVVGGKYRLLRELGRGGMATVYEAENELTLKRAAVKWLHPQFHDEGQGLQRVLREARAASRIRHDNVVDVYDVAEEGSAVYLVMELLRGELLSQVLERENLPMHELIALLVPAMRGVGAAHAAGVVHRDIKPDNIFLAHDPSHERAVPKLIDFGISKLTETDPSTATRSGITMGTPRYASYEQLLGARDVDVRTDVYAFGVILYECLTGRSPYGDAVTFAEQAVRFATRDAPPVRTLRPEVPEALEMLVQRAIAKHREDRTASLEALLLELVPFADPGKYPQPLPVRTQQSTRVTFAEGRRGSVGAGEASLEGQPTPSPERVQGRRRGLALTAIGVGTMALALLSMRFESPPRTRAARMPDEAWDAGIASQPTVVAPQAPAEPAPPPVHERPALVKKPRRVEVAPPAPAPPVPVPDALHRAGPLRRSEF